MTGSLRKLLSHLTTSSMVSSVITGEFSSELQQYSQLDGQPNVGIIITWKDIVVSPFYYGFSKVVMVLIVFLWSGWANKIESPFFIVSGRVEEVH